MEQYNKSKTSDDCPEGYGHVGQFWPKPDKPCEYPIAVVDTITWIILVVHCILASLSTFGIVYFGEAVRREQLKTLYARCGYYFHIFVCSFILSVCICYMFGIHRQRIIMIDASSSNVGTVYWFVGLVCQNLMSQRVLKNAHVAYLGAEMLRVQEIFKQMIRVIKFGMTISFLLAVTAIYDQKLWPLCYFSGFTGIRLCLRKLKHADSIKI